MPIKKDTKRAESPIHQNTGQRPVTKGLKARCIKTQGNVL